MTSSDVLISARGIGKHYRLHKRGGKGLLARLTGADKGGDGGGDDGFWALRGVDLEVRRGDALAIIGRNGAGKSTLLQIIAGLMKPNEGEIEVNGRVAALLELGAGFNPELTGRENVQLAASMMGLTNAEIRESFDSILAFAEIGDFIDQPVKRYSTGMYARLAFAVAAHVRADILIVDEVLAVGDAAFQQKCMRFIRRFTEHGALLFVSHDTSAVTSLCERALWLERGYARAYGSARDVTHQYLASLAEDAAHGESFRIGGERRRPERVRKTDIRADTLAASDKRNDLQIFDFDPDGQQFGAGGAVVEDVRLISTSGATLTHVTGGEEVVLRIACRAERDLANPIVGFYWKDRRGQNLFGDNTYLTTMDSPRPARQGERFHALFRFCLPYFAVGDYSINAAVADGDQTNHVQHHWLDDALFIRVESSHLHRGLIGLPMLSIELLPDAASMRDAGDDAAA